MKIDKSFDPRTRIIIAGGFLKFIIFDVIWCAGTTFRAMSDPALWVNAMLAGMLLGLFYVASQRLWLQAIAYVATDLLLIANLMYCRTYFTAIPLDSYLLAGNLADFTASVADSLRPADAALPIETLFIILTARSRKAGMPARLRYGIATTLVMLVSLGIGAIRGGWRAHFARLQESCYYATCTTPIYTVFGSMANDYLSEPSASMLPGIRADIDTWLADQERLRPHRPMADSIAPRRNLVMIVCESLESWVIGRSVDGQELTPTLNALIADTAHTLYAPKVLTQVASGRSIDFQLLANAGMLPMQKSVYSMKYPHNTYHTLNQAIEAADSSARSYILTCDKPVVWNQEPIARAFGIDTLIDRSAWQIDELVGNPPKLSDGSFMRQATAKMKAGEIWPEGERAFVMMITYSGHNPFRLPDELAAVHFSDKYPERMRDYMTMANYTDRSLATMLSYLRSRPDYDSTLIVITGDHEGLAANRAEILRTCRDAHGIVDSGQYTPLIVVNSPVGGRYADVMGQIDIYPTLLNLLGLDSARWKGMGQSILDPAKAAFAISSMTGETAGDTTTASPELMRHVKDARRISDLMIQFDYFGTQQ